MRIFDNLAAMRVCLPEGVCAPVAQVLIDMLDYIDGAIEEASFTALLGAPVYLVERVEDLASVLSFDETNGKRVSLAEAASGAFDVAEWIDEGSFARFLTIESANGGPQYLIPKGVADLTTTVRESVRLWCITIL